MKVRINTTVIKYIITVFFLVGNLALLALLDGDITVGFKRFMIIWEISVNVLAVFSYVMLSIFPRWYYVIDNEGVSFQNRKGKEIGYTSWEGVEDMFYLYEVLYEGVGFVFKEGYKSTQMGMTIFPKQVKMIYENVPKFKEIIDNGKYHICKG